VDDQQTNGLITISSADAMTYTLEVAGVGARSYAFVVDWHIRLLLALVWIYLAVFLFFDTSVFATLFQEGSDHTAALWVIFFPAVIVYFFYHPILESVMHGSTPGKRIAGVSLITLEGHVPGIGSILIRNVFRLVDSLPGVYTIGLLFVIFTRTHVRIGDLAAGTVLIYSENAGKHGQPAVTDKALNSGLTAENQDLLLELLERWDQLTKSQRVRLGQRFLKKIDHDLNTDDPHRLKSHLLKLAAK